MLLGHVWVIAHNQWIALEERDATSVATTMTGLPCGLSCGKIWLSAIVGQSGDLLCTLEMAS
jgi:hypothetical protein